MEQAKAAVFFQVQSLLILATIYLGVFFNKIRDLHIKIMSFAIAWDILLVLQIELSRGAVAKAVKVVSNPMLLNIHVSIAITTVVLYFVMIYTGRKLLHGDQQIRTYHRKFAILVLFLRTLVFITSFFAVT